MSKLSEREKVLMSFFINPKTEKIEYNSKCMNCIHNECKQSFRAVLIACPKYKRK